MLAGHKLHPSPTRHLFWRRMTDEKRTPPKCTHLAPQPGTFIVFSVQPPPHSGEPLSLSPVSRRISPRHVLYPSNACARAQSLWVGLYFWRHIFWREPRRKIRGKGSILFLADFSYGELVKSNNVPVHIRGIYSYKTQGHAM